MAAAPGSRVRQDREGGRPVRTPGLAISSIIALRAPAMGALASDFFKSDLFAWFAGALLVFGGLLIIAFHQYWSSVAVVMISLFGWILALRGVVLMAAPELYDRAAMSMGAISLVRPAPRYRDNAHGELFQL